MPIRLSGLDAGNPEYGIGSFMMVGDRTDTGSANDLAALGDLHSARWNFETLELSGNAPGIDVPIIGNSPSDFPAQQGPLDIINGFTLPGYVQYMEPFYRQLVNDERQLDPTSTTSPTLMSTQSGGRDAALAANVVADGLALTTSPVTTGFTAPPGGNPIRLGITPSSSSTAAVTLVGTDYNNVQITETVTLAGAGQVATTRFFKTVTSASASTGVTVNIGGSTVATNRRYVAIFRENDGGRLLPGFDVYARKGSVPNTYREVFMDGLSFSFSRDGSISLAFTAVGKRPQTNQFLGATSQPTIPDATYPLARRQAFVGWQSGLLYEDAAGVEQRLPLIDATFTLANNILFAPTITGRRFPGGAYRNRRNVTLEGTMEYRAADSDLMNDVLGNEFFEEVALEQVNATTGGFPYKTRYNFGRLQFTNLPDAPVSEEGIITRPVSLRAVESEDGSEPDVSIRVETLAPLELDPITL